MYASLGRWCFRHPWRVLGLWLVALLVLGGASASLGASYGGNLSNPGSESQRGIDLLETHFDGLGAGPRGTIVFRAEQGVDAPEVRSAMSALFADVDALDDSTVLSPYAPGGSARIASQGPEAGLIAFAEISLDPNIGFTQAQSLGIAINELIDGAGLRSSDGLQVEVGGSFLAEREPPESEAVGLALAIFILIVVLGSVVAMGATIGAAVVSVAVGVSGTLILSHVLTVPEFAPTIGVMIGLGVGIDYALFIITRYRECLDRGLTSEQSTAAAMDSAGRSVVFAGATVVISLLGMLFIGVPFVAGLGVAAAAAVAVVMAGSVTLLPALMGLLGDRLVTTRVRGMVASVLVAVALFGVGVGLEPLLIGLPLAILVLLGGSFGGNWNPLRRRLKPRQQRARRETGWYRLSRAVQARPRSFAVAGTLVLVLLAAPVLDLRLGFADEGNFGEETTARKAYDLLADGFGPGANGPLLVVAEVSDASQLADLGALSRALAGTAGVASAGPPVPSPDGRAAVIEVQPATAPQDEATGALVRRLRDTVIPSSTAGTGLEPLVTGLMASNIDLSEFLKGRTAIFFLAVLGASFALLTAVFRSIVVPLKAVIMNMLSIGAAYGVVVAVFQWGWFGGIVGIEPGPIEPFIPMMLFAVVFGLSMDYEVFLLSRMKEEFERTGDATNSVADGLALTARVISAAAAIMVVVFGSFVIDDDRVTKLLGLGLATAVAVDASLVRMLIVPSTMELLGARNWWLPRWLDRILPNLNALTVHVDDTGSAAATYTDTAAPAGTLYVYRVKAHNSAGTSARSNYVNVDRPA